MPIVATRVREQPQESRHGIVDKGRLRHHAAGDEKARDDEKHDDREPADLDLAKSMKDAAAMPRGGQREAVVEQHREAATNRIRLKLLSCRAAEWRSFSPSLVSLDLLRPRARIACYDPCKEHTGVKIR